MRRQWREEAALIRPHDAPIIRPLFGGFSYLGLLSQPGVAPLVAPVARDSTDAFLLKRHPRNKPARTRPAAHRLRAPALPVGQRPSEDGRVGCAVAAIFAGVLWLLPQSARAQIELPQADLASPIVITADTGFRWTRERRRLRDLGSLRQRSHPARARLGASPRRGDLDRPHRHGGAGRNAVIAYLEGNVVLDAGQARSRTHVTDRNWLHRFYTNEDVEVHAAREVEPPAQTPPIYQRAMSWRARSTASRRSEARRR